MHTPGPWVYSEGGDGEYRIYAPVVAGMQAHRAVFDVADVWLPDRDKRTGTVEELCAEREANGRLIAAAPDLAEALEAVATQLAVQRMWIKNWSPSFESDGEYIGDAALADQALEKASAALSKASQQQGSPHPIGQQNEGAES